MDQASELYDITTRLAVGDSGIVYKATERKSGRLVALKLLLPQGEIAHPLDTASLLRDAQEMVRFTGANIVPLLDAFADEDGAVLVYEFTEGTRGLDVPATCPIPAAQAVAVATQLLGALHCGEQQRYPHGDLKPSDISLAWQPDGSPRLNVRDWGLANYRQAPPPGSLPYMAPERLAGAPPTAAADLYSAGAVLFYLLTERPPIEGATKEALAAAWQPDHAAVLGELRPDLPPGLAPWIAALLQADASDRPSSAAEALTSLAAMTNPVPSAAPPRSSHRSGTGRTRPQPPPPNQARAGIHRPSRTQANQARQEHQRHKPKKRSFGVAVAYFFLVAALGSAGFFIWQNVQTSKKRGVAKPSTTAAATPPVIAPPVLAASTQTQTAPAPAAPAAPAAPTVSQTRQTPPTPPSPIAEPPKPPISAAAGPAQASLASSANPPNLDPSDIANLAPQAETDKWFFESKAESGGADAAKGQTFTTGDTPTLFRALTYKISSGCKKSATPEHPTTWTIRLGTVTGKSFTPIASVQAQQTADTGEGHYLTWTFATPVPLAAHTTYAVDVAMRSRTAWRTGIPYLACSKGVANPSVGLLYHSGDLGVGDASLTTAEGIDRIFHVDLQVQ